MKGKQDLLEARLDRSVDSIHHFLEETKFSDDEGLDSWAHKVLADSWDRYVEDVAIIASLPPPGGRVLDIGAAPFQMTYVMEQTGLNVAGVDIAPGRFQEGIDRLGLNIVACDVEKDTLPFPDGTFDMVVFTELFEHLRIDLIHTFNEVLRVLKPGGLLFLTTPNVYHVANTWNFLKGGGFFNPYPQFERLHTVGHMGHIREYSRSELESFMRDCGFLVHEHKYVAYTRQPGLLGWIGRIIPKFRLYQRVVFRRPDGTATSP